MTNIKLKYLAKIKNGKDPKDVYDLEGQYPIYGTGGVFGRSREYLYDKESVLIGRKGTIDKPQYVTEPFWSVDTAFYTEINTDVLPKYFYYAVKTIPFDMYKYGSAVPSLTQRDLNEIKLPKPELSIQQVLVGYLDKMLSDIDRLVNNNRKLIKLLEEKKKAIVNNVITKGLNPNVEMKDSGIEWIGSVAKHWNGFRLKIVSSLITVKASNSGKKIALENIASKTGSYIETDSSFDGEGIAFTSGDILFGKLRPYLAKVWKATFDGSAVGDFFVLRANADKLRPDFLKYLLLSDFYIDMLNGATYGAKMPRVSWSFMGNLKVALPSVEEQDEITRYIEENSQGIDGLIDTLRNENNLLREYKQSLIYHVVTGKLDVSNKLSKK